MTQTLVLKTPDAVLSDVNRPILPLNSIKLFNPKDDKEFYIWLIGPGLNLTFNNIVVLQQIATTDNTMYVNKTQPSSGWVDVNASSFTTTVIGSTILKLKFTNTNSRYGFMVPSNTTAGISYNQRTANLVDWSVRYPMTVLDGTFRQCPNVKGLTYLDTSAITAIKYCFVSSTQESDITNWDTSKVIDMQNCFQNSTSFNQPVGKWETSLVTNMIGIFQGATNFNQPLNSWNVSNVNNMSSMFSGAANFNQPLNSWNVSNVNNMSNMFSGAASFNQPLNSWNVSNVNNMTNMFSGAASFNQPLNSWNVSRVRDFRGIFLSAKNFNQALTGWNTSAGIYFMNMFAGATSFNQDLAHFNTSQAIEMHSMFNGASSFNQPINNWNISKCTTIGTIFRNATSFNQPLNNWDVSQCLNMDNVFNGATSFDQDVSVWFTKCPINANFSDFMSNMALSSANYDKILNTLWNDISSLRSTAWAARTTAKTIGFGSSKFSTASASARSNLIAAGWTISDGGAV